MTPQDTATAPTVTDWQWQDAQRRQWPGTREEYAKYRVLKDASDAAWSAGLDVARAVRKCDALPLVRVDGDSASRERYDAADRHFDYAFADAFEARQWSDYETANADFAAAFTAAFIARAVAYDAANVAYEARQDALDAAYTARRRERDDAGADS